MRQSQEHDSKTRRGHGVDVNSTSVHLSQTLRDDCPLWGSNVYRDLGEKHLEDKGV